MQTELNEDIETGNRIIADSPFSKEGLRQVLAKHPALYKELKYHTDWNKLMPVVEKISHIKIDWEHATDTDTYYPRTFGMLQADTGLPMVRINANQVFVGATLIEATWIAVIEFIKYYNSLNK